MPWRMTWQPPHIDKSIPVLELLPDGVAEQHWALMPIREAQGTTADGVYHNYYYCRHCKGWIEGQPIATGENTLGPLSGRNGTVYECIRCQEEIGFNGIVS